MAIAHPQFNAIAFHIPVIDWPVHWYGITYLAAFMMFLVLGKYRANKMPQLGFKAVELDDVLFYGMIGVILGGRLGYVLFYKLSDFMAHPLDIFKVWEGGMAFHGGFVGVMLAMFFYARTTKRGFLQVTDFIAPLTALGLAAGRWGNFMNGELWGRVSERSYSWLMVFKQAQLADEKWLAANPDLINHPNIVNAINTLGGLPRHPSQIYQMLGEGILLFILVWLYARKVRPTGAVSGLFLAGYGVMRFAAEFVREPDDYLGLSQGLSRGQQLSIPMIICGVALMVWAYKKRKST